MLHVGLLLQPNGSIGSGCMLGMLIVVMSCCLHAYSPSHF